MNEISFTYYDVFDYIQNNKTYSELIRAEKISFNENRVRSDDRLNNTIYHRILKISLKNDEYGLPQFVISGKVFMRGCIMFPFQLLGISKKRVLFKNENIDKYFDCLVNKKNVSAVRDELKYLSKTKFYYYLTLLSKLARMTDFYTSPFGNYVQIDFSGDRKINKADLDNVINALESLKTKEINIENVNIQTKRIRNIVNSMSADLASQVKFENGEWIYPEQWSVFISTISNDFWMDKNYTQLPVQEWINEGRKINTMNLDEVKALFTFIVRQERFCSGFWKSCIERGLIKKMI